MPLSKERITLSEVPAINGPSDSSHLCTVTQKSETIGHFLALFIVENQKTIENYRSTIPPIQPEMKSLGPIWHYATHVIPTRWSLFRPQAIARTFTIHQPRSKHTHQQPRKQTHTHTSNQP